MERNALSFIDLFSGCGGLSLGLLKSGWKGLFAIEQNPDAFETLKHNLVDGTEDYRPRYHWPENLEIKPYEISSFFEQNIDLLKRMRGKVNLVAGGPPCQGFSFAGKRTGKDPRNELFKLHLDIVDVLQPELVILENVHGIEVAFKNNTEESKPNKSYANLIASLLRVHGYQVQQFIIRAVDFGVPQLRPRYFTIGVRIDISQKLPQIDFKERIYRSREKFLSKHGLPVDRPITVSEAISDLSTSNKTFKDCTDVDSPSGFKEVVYEGPITHYQKLMHQEMDGKAQNSMRLVNHRPDTIKRFMSIQNSCRKGVQLSAEDKERFGIKKTAIVPLSPDKPSHTLTTLPDDLIHYSEPRVHTVREYARLQSFPDWFEFKGKFTTGGSRRKHECPRYTQVGNAVPPLLAEAIGLVLYEYLAQGMSCALPNENKRMMS